jgi:hypothetical protein
MRVKLASPSGLQATEPRNKNSKSKESIYPLKNNFQSIRNTLVENINEILVFKMLF